MEEQRERREKENWRKIFSGLAVIWQQLRPLSLNLISLLFAGCRLGEAQEQEMLLEVG